MAYNRLDIRPLLIIILINVIFSVYKNNIYVFNLGTIIIVLRNKYIIFLVNLWDFF